MIRPISRKDKLSSAVNPCRMTPEVRAFSRSKRYKQPLSVSWAEVKPLPKDAEERTRLTWVACAIRNLPFEIAYYFHPDGNKIVSKFVSLPESPLRVDLTISRNAWGSIHLHNHPGIDCSFSSPDGAFYLNAGVGEGIVVSKQSIYYLDPLILRSREMSADTFKDIIRGRYLLIMEELRKKYINQFFRTADGDINSFVQLSPEKQVAIEKNLEVEQPKMYKLAQAQADKQIRDDYPDIINKVWEELSQKYNLGYKVRKWKGLTGTI